ncbi:MAG: DUF2723 domain-containing protein [Elusimicrobiota bacterium]
MIFIGAGIFLFVVLLSCVFPAVAPYRDAGEMITVAETLGVAHPPGYPLYTLVSRVFLEIVPFGNAGYRLNALSAVFTVLTVILLSKSVLLFAEKYFAGVGGIGGAGGGRYSKLICVAASVVPGLSYLQWYLSTVPEMYTVNTFFAVLLIFIFLKWRSERLLKYVYLLSFISGLSLGVRLDVIFLIIPLFVPVVVSIVRRQKPLKVFTATSLLFMLGFSVYLYLPVRSAVNPFIDWNHPATLEKLYQTITRKTHGGTLDLISAQYEKGANFSDGLMFYLRNLSGGFAYIGVILGIIGFIGVLRYDRGFALAAAAAWFLSSVVFIYLGNMPPNPHALAILEAHFLLPDIIFSVFVVAGVMYAYSLPLVSLRGESATKQSHFPLLAILSVACMILFNFFGNIGDNNKRNNFFAYDYSVNVLRSVENDSLIVLKEDVQLFSLWFRQSVIRRRRDVAVIGQGLAGSQWYIDMMKRAYPDLFLLSLKTEQDWVRLIDGNRLRRVYASGDTDLPVFSTVRMHPAGLTSCMTVTVSVPQDVKCQDLTPWMTPGMYLEELYIYRGVYDYGHYREFFTPDLIEEYAKAFHRAGHFYLKERKDAEGMREAERFFRTALYYQEHFPLPAFNLGYLYLSRNDYNSALSYYGLAEKKYMHLLGLARSYKAGDAVVNGLKSDLAEVYLHMGVVSEKTGRPDNSIHYYNKAIEVKPDFAKAYFNKGVVYWGRQDWEKVVDCFRTALRIEPGYREAEYYLQQAVHRMRGVREDNRSGDNRK